MSGLIQNWPPQHTRQSMADIIEWQGITGHDIPVARVLKWARLAKLKNVIVIGETSEGEFYFAGSRASGSETLWDLEMAKKKLLDIADTIDT